MPLFHATLKYDILRRSDRPILGKRVARWFYDRRHTLTVPADTYDQAVQKILGWVTQVFTDSDFRQKEFFEEGNTAVDVVFDATGGVPVREGHDGPIVLYHP